LTVELRLAIPLELIADFCRRNQIHRLSLFGSALRDDFRPDSDIDLLVEFEPAARVGLIRLGGMELELESLLGRKPDLRTPADLSPYFHRAVIADAQVLYEWKRDENQPRGRQGAGTTNQ